MKVETNRFGLITLPDDKMIRMERPILGFEKLSEFCLIEIDDLTPFLWLQSTQDSSVAFLVANPVLFFPDYSITVHPKEIAELKVEDISAVETYVIISIDEASGRISANLQGPILIDNRSRLAKQLVLVNTEYSISHPIAQMTNTDQTVEQEREPELAY